MSGARRSLGSEETGVAQVLGALMIVAIMVGFFGVVRVDFVPAWESEVEVQHLRQAERDMTLLSTALLSDGDQLPHSEPITLIPTTLVNFGPPRFPAQVQRDTDLQGILVTSDEFTVVVNSTGGGNEETTLPQYLDWTTVESTLQVEDIGRITELRVRIENIKATDPISTFSIVWTDADGNLAATLSGTVEPSTDVIRVTLETTDGEGRVMGTRSDSVFIALEGVDYYLDVLDSQLRVGPTLSGTTGPLNMQLTYESGLVTNLLNPIFDGPIFGVAMTYENSQGITFGAGTEETDFQLAFDTTRFTYDYPTQFAIDQDYSLEYGAVVLSQPDGAAVRAAPGFAIIAAGSDLVIKISAPGTTSESAPTQSRGTTVVTLDPTTRTTLVGHATDMQIRMTTAYAEAWADHWRWSLQGAGFGDASGGTPGLTTTSSDEALTIRLTGSGVDPDARFERIIINLSSPSYGVEIE